MEYSKHKGVISMPYGAGRENVYGINNNPIVNWLFWITTVLRRWYWILLGLLLAGLMAYWQTQKWKPLYNSTVKLMYEQGNKPGNDFLNRGNYLGNSNLMANQIYMITSYDLIASTLKKLNFTTDYYAKGIFKTENIYETSPVVIAPDFIANQAYNLEFRLEGIDYHQYRITFDGTNKLAPFSVIGQYDVLLKHSLFFCTIHKSNVFRSRYAVFFRFRTSDDLINEFLGALKVAAIEENSSILSVTKSSYLGRRDVDFLNALCNEFIQENLLQKNRTAEKTIEFIERQLLIISDSVSASQSRLMDYQASNRMYTGDITTKVFSGLDDLEKNKSELQLKKVYLDYLVDYLNNNIQDGTMIAPVNVGVNDAGLAGLVTNYNDISRRLKDMSDKNPLYPKLLSAMSELKNMISATVKNMYNVYQMDKNQIDMRYNSAIGQMNAAPEKERKFLLLERNYKIHETYNAYLIQKRAEAQIQKASNTADYYVLEKARTIGVVNSEVPMQVVIFFLLAGLFCPVALIVVRELLDFTVKTVDDVERVSTYPLVGKIIISDKSDAVIVRNYPKSSFTEAFRAMRTRLEFVVGNQEKSSFVVTSAEPGDGKTYIALNLASVFQITGKRVVLVDFDLRKPAIGKVLKEEKHRGVSNYLVGQVEFDKIIHPHPDLGFDVIYAGTLPPNPGELTRSHSTKAFVEKLKQQYDCVILDCSPIGLVTDAHPLSYLVDTMLFVVRKNKTNKTFFRSVLQDLMRDSFEHVALIFNGLERSGKYGYNGNKYYCGNNDFHKQYYNDNYYDE